MHLHWNWTELMHAAAESRSSRWRNVILNGLLILFGLTLPAAVGEFAIRLSRHPMTSFDDRSFRQSPWCRLRPNSRDHDYVYCVLPWTSIILVYAVPIPRLRSLQEYFVSSE